MCVRMFIRVLAYTGIAFFYRRMMNLELLFHCLWAFTAPTAYCSCLKMDF